MSGILFCCWLLLTIYLCYDSSVLMAFLLQFRALLSFANTVFLSQWCLFEMYVSQHTMQ